MATGSAASNDHARDRAPLSVWSAPLDVPASVSAGLADYLSPEERRRADEYLAPRDRERFVAARGWLRRLLAGQLGCSPSEVPISTRRGGKPEIESSDLKFNASRSAGIALYATSWLTEVGVDVEQIRATAARDLDDIARDFFSPDEQQALAAVPAQRRLAATFRCWTCKEAYVKGIGEGLGFPIRTVATWAADGRPATVSGWTVHQIEMAPGFAAAVAGEGLEGWLATVPHPIDSPDSDPSPAIIEP